MTDKSVIELQIIALEHAIVASNFFSASSASPHERWTSLSGS
jgi:hypothetical protein